MGRDILIIGSGTLEVHLDTATVENPDDRLLMPSDSITTSINHAMFSPIGIENELFVSPH